MNAQELSKRYGWPLRIHARGYDAVLTDVQPLNSGKPAPVYRWPGGENIADEREVRMPAKEFHRLERILSGEPRAFDDRCELFTKQPVEWYRELALHAMKIISGPIGPDGFAQCRHDSAGWAAHHVTKAVFEEQDVFDPYADKEFIAAARALLPWYIDRYVSDKDC